MEPIKIVNLTKLPCYIFNDPNIRVGVRSPLNNNTSNSCNHLLIPRSVYHEKDSLKQRSKNDYNIDNNAEYKGY